MWYKKGFVLRLGQWEYVLRDSGSHWGEKEYWQSEEGAVVVEMVKQSFIRLQQKERKREAEVQEIEQRNAKLSPVYQEIKIQMQELESSLAEYRWYKCLCKEKRKARKKIRIQLDELETRRQEVWKKMDHFPHRLAIYFPSPHLRYTAPAGEYDPTQDCVWVYFPRQWECPRCKTELDRPEKKVCQCPGCQLWQIWWMEPITRYCVYADNPDLAWAGYAWNQLLKRLDMHLCLDEEWGSEHDEKLLTRLSSVEWKWCEKQWLAQQAGGLV